MLKQCVLSEILLDSEKYLYAILIICKNDAKVELIVCSKSFRIDLNDAVDLILDQIQRQDLEIAGFCKKKERFTKLLNKHAF